MTPEAKVVLKAYLDKGESDAHVTVVDSTVSNVTESPNTYTYEAA